MFCKNCGTENSDGALYCSNDGVVLSKVSERVHLSRDSEKFCKHCGHENTVGGYYCVSCGHSFEKVVEKEEEKLSVSNAASAVSSQQVGGNFQSGQGFIASLTDVSTLIHSGKFIGMSIVALLIISFSISSLVNGLVSDLISDEIGPIADLIDINLVSFTDVMMLSHLLGLNFTINAMFIEGAIQTSSGLFLLLIIPAIVFIVMGFLMQRKYPESTMVERLTRCLSFSIPYAILFGLFSLFAGTSLKMKDPTGFTEVVLTFTSDYSFFESIFNAFIISSIFTSIGAMIRLSKEQRTYNYQYGLSISRAILHSMVGLAVAMVVGFFVMSSSDNLTTDDPAGDLVIGTQVGGYIWNVSQFETLKLKVETFGEKITASYSLLGGAKASLDGADTEDEAEFKDEFKEEFKEQIGGLGLASWLLVLITFALHFWAGKQLIKSSGGNILFEVGAYAVTFGLVNALIVGITKISADLNMDDAIVFSLGFSSIGVFFISTILAYVVSYGSVMLLGRQTSSSQGQRYSA
ncbi:zinc ribbon domain-containing protein [Bacillus sp. JJ1521]|uniref:zinc ribbon domain-containing protein n=1 Tax=Bacillus sp. JJ1521 TaxID=3122957 RepID=UPI002FFE46F8